MAKRTKKKTTAPSEPLSAPSDPIRIVPLRVPHDLLRPTVDGEAAVAPQLTYRNGPLMTSVQVFTIFWGSAWTKDPQKPLVAQVNQFFDSILGSALIDQLTEYNVTGKTIKHGKRTGTRTVTAMQPASSTSDAAIQRFLQQQISANAKVPRPGANTLYFLFLPPGVRVVQGGAASCQAFCGYHNATSSGIFYAVMPYPGCTGCRGDLTVFDALTSTSSHELCEAITDPIPGAGWYDDANGEIGDICAWQTKKVGAYTVQLEWSNRTVTCV
jgi:hypothetical protein